MRSVTPRTGPCECMPVERTAEFRFYEELNDFLPPVQRRRTFERFDIRPLHRFGAAAAFTGAALQEARRAESR